MQRDSQPQERNNRTTIPVGKDFFFFHFYLNLIGHILGSASFRRQFYLRYLLESYFVQVKNRTSNFNISNAGSHVMEYGNGSIRHEKLYLYQGFDPATVNFPPYNSLRSRMEVVNQRDAELIFLWQMVSFSILPFLVDKTLVNLKSDPNYLTKFVFVIEQYKNSENGSKRKEEILKQIKETTRHRAHLDGSMELIGSFLYGPHKGSSILNSVREPGMPLVDDWRCLKSTVNNTFYI